MTTPGVDFFRIDRSASTRRVLVAGVVMVMVGASSVGAHLIRRLPTDVGHAVSLVGGLTMVAGLVLSFGAMAMRLFENVYLAIREDGLLLHDNGRETIIPWDELTAVAAEPKGIVALCRAQQDRVRWHAGKEAVMVAGRIQEAKRKAAHGLLRTSSPPPS